jgi:hypothetical protein
LPGSEIIEPKFLTQQFVRLLKLLHPRSVGRNGIGA